MMNTPNNANIRKDVYLLGNTLLRLGLPQLVIRLVVSISVLALLLYCVQSILARGKAWLEFSLLLSGLNDMLGKTVIDFVMEYQKFFWWFVAALLILFVLNGLISWLKASIKRGRAASVPLGEMRKLCTGLSQEALDVLDWVWRDKSNPVTVGNVQSTLSQLRSSRHQKLELARAQKLELELAIKTYGPPTLHAPSPPPPASSGQREPTLLA